MVYDTNDIGEEKINEIALLKDGFTAICRYDFDGAKAIFSEILDKYPESINAYWGYLLAWYGIVYVKGFYDGKISPTYCFQEYDPQDVQYFSQQEKFKKILSLLEGEESVAQIYRDKAAEIDKALDEFQAAEKEKEYDVFLCVKISKTLKSQPSLTGNTEDYDEAMKLYKTLTKQGKKVFFSKIALENDPKSDMEIWKHLVKSKKMLLITSKRDYVENESPWVHSEWERWLHLDRNGDNYHSKNLYIYLVGDMTAKKLPERLKRQVYVKKDGMTEDLIEDICKESVAKTAELVPTTETITSEDPNTKDTNGSETLTSKKENNVAFGFILSLSLIAILFGVWGSFRYIFTDHLLWWIYIGLNILVPAELMVIEGMITVKQSIVMAVLMAIQIMLIICNQWELIIREKIIIPMILITIVEIALCVGLAIYSSYNRHLDICTLSEKIMVCILNIFSKSVSAFVIIYSSLFFIAAANVPIQSHGSLLYIEATDAFNNCSEEDKDTYAVWFGNYWDDELIIPTYINGRNVAIIIKSTKQEPYIRYSRMETVYIPSTMKYIGDNAFDCCDKLETVYYAGSEEAWKKVTVCKGNDAILQADIYFYSETKPQIEGLYWHYVDGVITEW